MATHRIIWTGLLIMSVINRGYAGAPAGKDLGEEARLVARGNNRFALELYQKLSGGEENLFLSPYSISTALALAYAGAGGRTEEQMAEVLRFPTSAKALQELGAAREPMTQEQLAEAFGRIIKDLNARGGEDNYELRVANALWGQRGYEFLDAYVQLVEKQYGGKLQEVDFVAATEKARQTINAWVERQTNDKIKNLIAPGVLDATARLVLTNAIYFKGDWARQFKEDQTKEEPFTRLDGSTVQAPMMNQRATFGYAETDALQVLEMPYRGEELSMVVLLPRTPDGIGGLEQEFTRDGFSDLLGRVRRREVIVVLPRFKMTSKFSLGPVLRAMGIADAFTRDADFSGMTGRRDLFLSAVIHQAYVDVNEEGTEAAAATGAVMKILSAQPERIPIFRADHPFLFLIRDKTSDSILFLGRLMNPQT